jgi:hypothetical protein
MRRIRAHSVPVECVANPMPDEAADRARKADLTADSPQIGEGLARYAPGDDLVVRGFVLHEEAL